MQIFRRHVNDKWVALNLETNLNALKNFSSSRSAVKTSVSVANLSGDEIHCCSTDNYREELYRQTLAEFKTLPGVNVQASL